MILIDPLSGQRNKSQILHLRQVSRKLRFTSGTGINVKNLKKPQLLRLMNLRTVSRRGTINTSDNLRVLFLSLLITQKEHKKFLEMNLEVTAAKE